MSGRALSSQTSQSSHVHKNRKISPLAGYIVKWWFSSIIANVYFYISTCEDCEDCEDVFTRRLYAVVSFACWESACVQ